MRRRIWYIFHGRFPSEKAASLWAAKTAEALMRSGASVTLLAPRRRGIIAQEHSVRVAYLPTLDLFSAQRLRHGAFWISALVFALTATIYLLRHGKKVDAIFSNEPQAMFLVSFFFPNCFYELHVAPTDKFFLYRSLFRRMRGFVTITKWGGDELVRKFGIPRERIMHAPGGVSIKQFDIPVSKDEARKKLDLPFDKKLALYTGHLYEWKGVDTLAQAAALLPQDTEIIFVGGTPNDVEVFKKKYATIPNIHIIGHQPHEAIPLWQRAADVLVLPNTEKKRISKYNTSPMKLFEYMASGVPIVASDLPSLREVISDDTAVFVAPDNPAALAEGITRILSDFSSSEQMGKAARNEVERYSWKRRSDQIGRFIGRSFS